MPSEQFEDSSIGTPRAAPRQLRDSAVAREAGSSGGEAEQLGRIRISRRILALLRELRLSISAVSRSTPSAGAAEKESAGLDEVRAIVADLEMMANDTESDSRQWERLRDRAVDDWMDMGRNNVSNPLVDLGRAVVLIANAAVDPRASDAESGLEEASQLARRAALGIVDAADGIETASGLTSETKPGIVPAAEPNEEPVSDHRAPLINLPEKDAPLIGAGDESPTTLDAFCDAIGETLDRAEARVGLSSLSMPTDHGRLASRLQTIHARLTRIEAAEQTGVRVDTGLTEERQRLREIFEQSLARQQEVLEEQTRKLESVIDRVQDTVATPKVISSRKESPSRGGLMPQELAVFEEIDKVTGTDATARSQVQRILDTLAEHPVTEALAVSLKQILKERHWGVKCPTCGKPAAPRWTGASMQFIHSIRPSAGQPTRTVTHSGMSIFQSVQIVDRPDIRIRKNK
jgi:hypothetical protein